MSHPVRKYVGFDEMPHSVAFYLGLHCLQKYHFIGFQSTESMSCVSNEIFPVLMPAEKIYERNVSFLQIL